MITQEMNEKLDWLLDELVAVCAQRDGACGTEIEQAKQDIWVHVREMQELVHVNRIFFSDLDLPH